MEIRTGKIILINGKFDSVFIIWKGLDRYSISNGHLQGNEKLKHL